MSLQDERLFFEWNFMVQERKVYDFRVVWSTRDEIKILFSLDLTLVGKVSEMNFL